MLLMWGRSNPRACLLLSRLAGLAAAGLALFHGWLLCRRLSDPAGLELGALLRWIAGLGLLGFLLVLRRLRVPLFWGRKALTFWSLVLLLHWNASAPPHEEARATLGPSPAQELLLILPGALSVAAVVAAGVLALTAVRVRTATIRPRLAAFVLPPLPFRLTALAVPGESPRPPPFSSIR